MKAAPPEVAPVAASRSRLVTWRVVLFVAVLLGVLLAAAVIVSRSGTAWAVTLDGSTVVVKEGKEIRRTTPLQLNQMPPDIQTELLRGRRFDDRAAADDYIDGITRRALAAGTMKPTGAGSVLPNTTASTATTYYEPGATVPSGPTFPTSGPATVPPPGGP